jgi:EF hand
MRSVLMLLVAVIAMAAPTAHAQRWRTPVSATEPAPPPVKASGDYLTRMDADADGKVSLLEYQDWLSYAFDNMDRNRDGTLAPDEQPGGRGTALTRDAHRARLAETFKRQDRNRDGALDSRELAAPPQAK